MATKLIKVVVNEKELFHRVLSGRHPAVVSEILDHIEELNELLYETYKRAWPEYNRLWHIVGGWRCVQSPIELCIYDHFRDPVHDDCLFCHQPQERK